MNLWPKSLAAWLLDSARARPTPDPEVRLRVATRAGCSLERSCLAPFHHDTCERWRSQMRKQR